MIGSGLVINYPLIIMSKTNKKDLKNKKKDSILDSPLFPSDSYLDDPHKEHDNSSNNKFVNPDSWMTGE